MKPSFVKKKKWNFYLFKWVGALAIVLTAALLTNLALNRIATWPGFTIKVVSIKGTLAYAPMTVLKAVGAQVGRGNFFSVDMKNVQAEFEKVAWIRTAAVRRVWPDRLEVTLEEHVPYARWGSDGLLNVQGEVFYARYVGELPRFSGPVGSEREVAEAYRDFDEILKGAELQPREVLLSPRRAWEVKLSSGMMLELGRVEMRERLARFVEVNKVQPELRDRGNRADLRYSNGFALRLNKVAAAKQNTKIKKIVK